MNSRSYTPVTLLCGVIFAAVLPVLLNLFYLTFFVMRSNGTDLRMNVPAWCAVSALVYLLSVLGSRKFSALSLWIALDAVLITVGTAAVILLSPADIPLAAKIITGIIIVCGLFAVCFSSVTPPTIPIIVRELDFTLLGTMWCGLIFVSQYGIPDDFISCLAALVADAAALLLLRTFGESRSVLFASRVRGFLLCGGILAAAAVLILLFNRFLALQTRGILRTIFGGIGTFFLFLGRKISQFFHWLASFVELPEEESIPIDQQTASQDTSSAVYQEITIDWGALLLRIAVVAAIILAVVLVIVLIRTRKKRIRRNRKPARQQPETRVRLGRARASSRRLQEFRFRLYFFLHRKTPEGLLVWLENWGARHRKPRRPGETYRAYFRRIAQDPKLKEDRAQLLDQLEELGEYLDRLYFSGERGTISRRTLKQIHHRFAGIEPPDSTDSPAA